MQQLIPLNRRQFAFDLSGLLAKEATRTRFAGWRLRFGRWICHSIQLPDLLASLLVFGGGFVFSVEIRFNRDSTPVLVLNALGQDGASEAFAALFLGFRECPVHLGKERQSVFEYIEVYYNRIRRHSALNYQTPIQFAEAA